MGRGYLIRLPWGLGDVLCSTAALRELKKLDPTNNIIYQTLVKGRRRLEYDAPGRPMGSGGAPSEFLLHNPNVDMILDVDDPAPMMQTTVDLAYGNFGGESLDHPFQSKFFDKLGLPWDETTRFGADYYMTPEEEEWTIAELDQLAPGHERFCALVPKCGWAGKMWTGDGWTAIVENLPDYGWKPVVFSGRKLHGPPWTATLNMSGRLDMRQTAAMLSRCGAMLTIEGCLSNLRFALGLSAVVLTCATKFGVQVWAPPELAIEVRSVLDCEPCMWRGEHMLGKHGVPPANTRGCPVGRSIRDVPASDVWRILEESLQKAEIPCPKRVLPSFMSPGSREKTASLGV